eukprot:531940_1
MNLLKTLYLLLVLINGEMEWTTSEYELPVASYRPIMAKTSNKEIYHFGGTQNNWYWNIDRPFWWRYLSDSLPSAGSCVIQPCAAFDNQHTIYFMNENMGQMNEFDLLTQTFTVDTISGVIGHNCLTSDFNEGGDSLYFAGNDVLKIYNTTNQTWIRTEPITIVGQTSYTWPQCQYLNGNVWLFGGLGSGSNVLNIIMRYNVKAMQWTSFGLTIPTGFIDGAAVLGDDGYIYLFGGLTTTAGSSRTGNTYKFNPDTLSLSIETLNPFSPGRYHFGAFSLNSNLYTFGGYTSTSINNIQIGNLSHKPISGPYFDGISTEWEYYLNVPWNSYTGTWDATMSWIPTVSIIDLATNSSVVYLIGGRSYRNNVVTYLDVIWKWDSKYPNIWTRQNAKAVPLYCTGCEAVINNRYVYLIGSHITPAVYGSIFIYDIILDTFSEYNKSTMPIPSLAGCVSTNGIDIIYYFGGQYAGSNYLGQIQIFNITNDSWTISSMIGDGNGLGSPDCIYNNNNVFIFGGRITYSGWVNSDRIWRYDIIENYWYQYQNKLTHPTIQSRTLLFNNKVYMVGGYDSENSGLVWNNVYEFDTDLMVLSSTTIQPMLLPKRGPGFTLIYQNGIYWMWSLGGMTDDAPTAHTSKTERANLTGPKPDVIPYTAESLDWTYYDSTLPYGLAAAASASIIDVNNNETIIYLFGGLRAGAPSPFADIYKWSSNSIHSWIHVSVDTPWPFACYSRCSVIFNDIIYILGPANPYIPYQPGTIFLFNTTSEEFMNNSYTMPHPADSGCVTSNDIDVIFYFAPPNYLQIWNTSSNEWLAYPDIAELPLDWISTTIFAASCQYENDYIFIFGGGSVGGGAFYNHNFRYDIINNEWAIFNDGLDTPVREARAIKAANNKIYIIGGGTTNTNQLDSVYEFDPSVGEIQQTNSLIEGRIVPIVEIVYIDSLYYLFVIGGRYGSTSTYISNGEIALIPGQPTTSPTLSPIGGQSTASMEWTTSEYELPVASYRPIMAKTSNKEIYHFGGTQNNWYWNIDRPFWWRYLSDSLPSAGSCVIQPCAAFDNQHTIYFMNENMGQMNEF